LSGQRKKQKSLGGNRNATRASCHTPSGTTWPPSKEGKRAIARCRQCCRMERMSSENVKLPNTLMIAKRSRTAQHALHDGIKANHRKIKTKQDPSASTTREDKRHRATTNRKQKKNIQEMPTTSKTWEVHKKVNMATGQTHKKTPCRKEEILDKCDRKQETSRREEAGMARGCTKCPLTKDPDKKYRAEKKNTPTRTHTQSTGKTNPSTEYYPITTGGTSKSRTDRGVKQVTIGPPRELDLGVHLIESRKPSMQK